MTTFPRRTLTGLAAASVLTLAAFSGIPETAGADTTAAPTEDCAPAYQDSNDFAPLVGTSVVGLTVVHGTTPETFHGTVLGVLDKAIDLSTPLIMMRLGTDGISDGSSATPADDAITADGVWEGMSGSPVYTIGADGQPDQLIGAVSTGLANGGGDIIGITPATAMLRYLPGGTTSAARVSPAWSHPSATMRSRLAAAAGISSARAAAGLRPLTLLTERGLGTAALRHAQGAAKVRGLHKGMSTGQIAGASAQDVPASTLIAGGNVADMVVWGDYAEGGIGTVTTVCHNGLVAFGHPLDGTGVANDALVTADVVYVQPDKLGIAFKVANLGVPAGTFTKDYNAAIGGTLGATPAGAATFRHTASYHGATRTSVSYAADPNFWIDAAYYAGDANDYTVMKAFTKGGGVVSFTIKGTSNGTPFTLRHTDRYLSRMSIADDSLTDMGNFVYDLSGLPGVHIASVTTTSQLDDNTTALHITAVQQRVRGTWTTVDGAHPAFARPGSTLALRALLTSATGATSYQPLSVPVPARAGGGRGEIQLLGGNSQQIPFYRVHSVASAQQALAGVIRNDQIGIGSTFVVGGSRATSVRVSAPGGHVVGGVKTVPVVVG